MRLLNRDLFRGRISAINDQGFTLQYVSAGKIEERTVPFVDVKSIRHYDPLAREREIVLAVLVGSQAGPAIGLALAHH